MKTIKKATTLFCLVALVVTMSSFAFFGERHAGNGATKELAAAAADARAKKAADRKKTCYTEAQLEDCIKEDDGTWTCYATSANHKGSCP